MLHPPNNYSNKINYLIPGTFFCIDCQYKHQSIQRVSWILYINDIYTNTGYILRIDCWEAEKNLRTTPGSDCALTSLAIDEPLEYARLYLDGNLQMWVDAEDSLEL